MAEFKNWGQMEVALAACRKQRDSHFAGWNTAASRLVEINTYITKFVNADPSVTDDAELAIRHVLVIVKGKP